MSLLLYYIDKEVNAQRKEHYYRVKVYQYCIELSRALTGDNVLPVVIVLDLIEEKLREVSGYPEYYKNLWIKILLRLRRKLEVLPK